MGTSRNPGADFPLLQPQLPPHLHPRTAVSFVQGMGLEGQRKREVWGGPRVSALAPLPLHTPASSLLPHPLPPLCCYLWLPCTLPHPRAP